MQPKQRGPRHDRRPAHIPCEAWAHLKVPTVNGFWLIAVGLFWWHEALFDKGREPTEKEAEDWEEVVDDVAWMVEQWDTSGTGTTGDDQEESRHRKHTLQQITQSGRPKRTRRGT